MTRAAEDPAELVDLYRLLHACSTDDAEALRAAYRHQAWIHHPDRGGEQFYMVALNRAWAILREPARRHAYDRRMGFGPVDAQPVSVSRTDATPSPTPPTGRACGTILDFGRYRGWSIGQLATHDPDYLLWLERTPYGRSLRSEILAAVGMRAHG